MHRTDSLKSLVLFLLSNLVCFSAYGNDKQICVGELKYPKGDAGGGKIFNEDTVFTISISSSEVELGKGDSKVLELPDTVEGKYISIKKNGRPYSSIKYQPNKFKSSKICMWLYWPHATWQLDSYKKGKYGCNCF